MNEEPPSLAHQHRAPDLFVSVEEVLAPILAVVFAAIVGIVFLHAYPGQITKIATKASHYSSLQRGSRNHT